MKKTLVSLILIAILTSGCASMRAPEKAAIGCTAFDLATTTWGLAEGLEEVNPLLNMGDGNEILTLAVSVAVSAGVHYALRRLVESKDKGHHPGRGKMWGAQAGIRCAAGAWNLNQIWE